MVRKRQFSPIIFLSGVKLKLKAAIAKAIPFLALGMLRAPEQQELMSVDECETGDSIVPGQDHVELVDPSQEFELSATRLQHKSHVSVSGKILSKLQVLQLFRSKRK